MGDKKERNVHLESQKMQRKRKKKKNYKYIKYKIKAFALFLFVATVLSFVCRFLPFQSETENKDNVNSMELNITNVVNGSYFRHMNYLFNVTFPWNHSNQLLEEANNISENENKPKVLFGRNTLQQNGLGMIFIPSMKPSMAALMQAMNDIKNYSPDTPMVALTFDDGPSKHTDRLLDILVDNDAKATFYIVGSRINFFPETIEKMVEFEMELGNHTYDHKYLTSMDADQEKIQLNEVDNELKSLTGKESVSIRPPGGHIDDTPSSAITKPFIMWSIDTLDWSSRNAASIEDVIIENVSDGDVILLHDLYESTVDAMEIVVPKLKEMGYELVTISELAQTKGYTLEAGRVYRSFPLIETE